MGLVGFSFITMVEKKEHGAEKKAHTMKVEKKKDDVKKKSVSSSTKKNGNGLLITVLVLVVVQMLVILGLGVAFVDLDDKVAGVEEKVTRLDGFFGKNVPGYGSDSEVPTPAPEVEEVDASSLKIEGEPTLGDVDAPVTVVEFSDYGCGFCGKWHSESFVKLKEEFIDTGKVKFVYKDFPLRDQEAAVASNCVMKELGSEKYFEMQDKIFNDQREMSSEQLLAWAKEIGVDESKYSACIADEAMKEELKGDLEEGSALGVSGTPSFFINGKKMVGAQPYEVLKQMIEAELAGN